jgi:hypothetical protein
MKKARNIHALRIASEDCTSRQWPHRINIGKSTAKQVMDVRKIPMEIKWTK